jgi:hypothetical protein
VRGTNPRRRGTNPRARRAAFEAAARRLGITDPYAALIQSLLGAIERPDPAPADQRSHGS